MQEPRKVTKYEPNFNCLNFHRANYEKMNELLSQVDWDKINQKSTKKEFPLVFMEKVLLICKECAPMKKDQANNRKKSLSLFYT